MKLFMYTIRTSIALLCIGFVLALSPLAFGADGMSDADMLDKVQRDAFLFMWEGGDPNCGMALEVLDGDDKTPVAVGGTGFGIAAVVVAVDRGWISREEALARLSGIVSFLRDATPRRRLYGAFPHWLNGKTGHPVAFSKKDSGADIVETSLLMQGLLIARAYFNGPGVEADLRREITRLWEAVDWNWFTAGEEQGLHWHWSPEHGHSGLKIRGYNECLITYVLALSSPTHPISRATYDYWTSGDDYQPRKVYGYEIEASLPGAGPLFLAHYSFIGLDPRRMADAYVPHGYFVRNTRHVLSNRGYCLQNAPARNKYSEGFWGLTASRVKKGYAAGEPAKDSGTVAPTAALASMPYTPHYAFQVLETLLQRHEDGPFAGLPSSLWGPFGPYDAVSLRDSWVSNEYLSIDQLPIVCMIENYRTGLLWDLLMSDPDVRSGLAKAGIREPELQDGFPEVVVPLVRSKKKYVPDAYDLRRHPDMGLYSLPFWSTRAGRVQFELRDTENTSVRVWEVNAVVGRNQLRFPDPRGTWNGTGTVVMHTPDGEEHRLPIRLH